jgi:hypothetical protein
MANSHGGEESTMQADTGVALIETVVDNKDKYSNDDYSHASPKNCRLKLDILA